MLQTIWNNKSYRISSIIFVVVFFWILSGQFSSAKKEEVLEEKQLSKVRVLNSTAKLKPRILKLRGVTEADKKVELKVEASGRVVKLHSQQGQWIKKDGVILELDINDKQFRLDEALAIVKQRKVEYQANKELIQKQYSSESKLLEAEALLEAAEARYEAIKIELDNTVLKAPFDGFIERKYVEEGDYLMAGSSAVLLISQAPMLFVSYVSEDVLPYLSLQNQALVDVRGIKIKGKMNYISTVADSVTRMFRVEVVMEKAKAASGLTGDADVFLGQFKVHKLPKSTISLTDDGQIGVKVVEGDIVKFYPIRLIEDDNDSIYVEGVPEESRVIVIGQEYVKDGERVIVGEV